MLPSLIKALQDPACYAHPVTEPIKVIETQVSWVLLTGEFVYKIKKELDFGFLNFSTLVKRQYYCEEELRLNQRLAPDIYLAVVKICGSISSPKITELPLEHDVQFTVEDSSDIAVDVLEYAVRMRQFDPEAGLDVLLAQNKFEVKWIDQLAEKLSAFHQKLPTVASNSPWGEATNIWQLVSDNYLHTLDFCTKDNDLKLLNQLYAQTTQDYRALEQTFVERRKLGFIRECHGDLHLGNVTLYNDELRLFDCIEFNLQFRWIDTCSDLAFLLMDLEANDKFSWANITLNRYLALSGDYQCLQLLTFYKSFRSMVRAKVATLGPQACHDTFTKYLQLTHRYQQKAPPILLLMHGLSGSGKSYLSRKIIENTNFIRLRSETQRANIHKELLKKGKKLDLHSPEINSRLSQHLLNLTQNILKMGYNVVVDGTFLKQHFRQKYIDVAQQLQVPLYFISCSCEPRLMKARLIRGINTRSHDSDFSLERLAVQQDYQQPLEENQRSQQIVVNTDDDQDIDNFIDRVVDILEQQAMTSND